MSRAAPAPLAGRTAVITGAGSGIGRSLAQRLAAHGCPLALIDANGEALMDLAATIESPLIKSVLDVRDGEGLLAFAAEVRDFSPAPIGAVFNNAGVAMGSPLLADSPAEEARVMAINFDGVVNGVRAFLPILLEQRDGALVNTSSIFGLTGVANQTAYCASKFAVRGFTEALQRELLGTGVRAIVVHPGGIKTNIIRDAHMHPSVRGERSREEHARAAEARARTTPDRAAEILHEGVDEGRSRILIGRDARFVDLLARLAPSRAVDVLEGLDRLAARARARRS